MSLTQVPPEMLDSDVPTPADITAAINAVLPIGSVIDYGGSAAPDPAGGVTWLLAYGQAVSRTTYATLFSRLGTTFGVGDGATTFNLPDYRGRVGVGQDDMGGVSADRITAAVAGFDGDALGATGGDQRLHQHTHAVTDPGHDHDIPTFENETGGSGASAGSGVAGVTGTSATASTGITIQNAGAGNSQNVQPSIVVNKLIRVL